MEIKGKVHYVGVNDRTKALFENLWPLPYGVSYNSYLIADDDMVALVDTVDVGLISVWRELSTGQHCRIPVSYSHCRNVS